jgi:hypothetical protein
MKSTYKNDSIDSAIQDLHAWRRELSDQFCGNVQAIVDDAIRRQESSGHQVIRRQQAVDVPVHHQNSATRTDQNNAHG